MKWMLFFLLGPIQLSFANEFDDYVKSINLDSLSSKQKGIDRDREASASQKPIIELGDFFEIENPSKVDLGDTRDVRTPVQGKNLIKMNEENLSSDNIFVVHSEFYRMIYEGLK